MKLFLDCLPCMLRQILEASYMVTDDENIHENIMDEAIKTLLNYKNYKTAPELGHAMHSIVKKHTGINDPYKEIKDRDIAGALKIEPLVRKYVDKENDYLLSALRISATGNVMDSAMNKDLDIESCYLNEIKKPFAISNIDAFKEDLSKGKKVLIIGDNAGEVVFDKILVEHLSLTHEVIYAVRDKPIINDATIEDALKTGIQNHSTLISTGCGVPGAVLELCSQDFKKIYTESDIVISKGQGNFEALSSTNRTIYFLLKAKCHKIASALDVNVNDYVFKKVN